MALPNDKIISLTPQIQGHSGSDDDDENNTFRFFGSQTSSSLIDDDDDDEDKDEYRKWPPFSNTPYFDWSVPTNLVYQQATSLNAKDSPLQFTTPFQHARSRLDYTVHNNPALRRQTFQDTILNRIVEQVQASMQEKPSIVFTIGPLGAGISYVLTQLYQRGLFPLDEFIKVDPEKIQQELPEMAGYHEHIRRQQLNKDDNDSTTTSGTNNESARHQVRGEAGQITDVLFEHALLNSLPMLVDIRSTTSTASSSINWYSQLWDRLRKEYPQYRIVLLSVVANTQVLHDRATSRITRMGIKKDHDLLETSIQQVPETVKALQSKADVSIEILNNENEPLMLKLLHRDDDDDDDPVVGINWKWFGNLWNHDMNQERFDEDDDQVSPIISCRMNEAFEDPAQHNAARSIWGQAYPNFCPRCSVACDGQCGKCIHGKHICACDICKQVQ